MNPWLLAGSLSYAALAVGHSWIGERRVVQPLLRQAWAIGLPRRVADPLVRWAWHLTSLAWLAAAVILGWAASGGAVPGEAAVPVLVIDALGGLALVTGAIVLIALRGVHAAWALCMVAGLACWVGAHGWPDSATARGAAGVAAALVLAALGALHIYWAAGGRRGRRAALPTRHDGTPVLRPDRVATIAVAVALLGASAVVASAAGVLPHLPWARVLGLAAAAAFGLRMIGDFRVVGLFKRERRTEFARWDSMLFSPLCGALCAACAVAAA